MYFYWGAMYLRTVAPNNNEWTLLGYRPFLTIKPSLLYFHEIAPSLWIFASLPFLPEGSHRATLTRPLLRFSFSRVLRLPQFLKFHLHRNRFSLNSPSHCCSARSELVGFLTRQMFFTGDSSTRKRVDLGGRSSKERDRQKLLEQTRLERNRRLSLRQQNFAALKIQVLFPFPIAFLDRPFNFMFSSYWSWIESISYVCVLLFAVGSLFQLWICNFQHYMATPNCSRIIDCSGLCLLLSPLYMHTHIYIYLYIFSWCGCENHFW